MRIQMSHILVLFFSAVLSLEIVGGAKCFRCSDVEPTNVCQNKPYECKGKFCFIKKYQQKGKPWKVIRGCTRICKTGTRIKKAYMTYTWCCSSDNCNSLHLLKWIEF